MAHDTFYVNDNNVYLKYTSYVKYNKCKEKNTIFLKGVYRKTFVGKHMTSACRYAKQILLTALCWHIHMCVCVCVCMCIYIYMCVCICVCIYIYICRYKLNSCRRRSLLRLKHINIKYFFWYYICTYALSVTALFVVTTDVENAIIYVII